MRRVVITGCGAITPLGNDVKTTWEKLLKGESGVDTIKSFDTSNHTVKIAGEVKDFHPETKHRSILINLIRIESVLLSVLASEDS
jgi:3-oxoacyl-(acyl-carrier-protein) synthase